MGCVSSTFLSHDDDFSQIGASAGLGHHIVSLTSTTYGLLTLDPPSSDHSPSTTTTVPPTPPPRFTLGSLFPSPLSEPRTLRSEPPEIINSWELMAGLDSTTDSFRFTPLPSKSKPFSITKEAINKENSNPNLRFRTIDKSSIFKPLIVDVSTPSSFLKYSLDGFEKLCPPNGDSKVVVYTTTLRGVRKTFEACNAVRAVIEGLGVSICERDISMDRGFREELRDLMKGKENSELVPPRVFVKGRYIGGAEEVMKIVEEGCLGDFLHGLPKLRAGYVCEGCGGGRFLPCFQCNGSCKMVMVVKEEMGEQQGRMVMVVKEEMGEQQGRTVVVRCSDCNENGLILCPICS